jgi:hypothetical protein
MPTFLYRQMRALGQFTAELTGFLSPATHTCQAALVV